MESKRKRFWNNKRFRLMLTLELAVMLPAAALIYVNYHHLKSIKRDKQIEAAIHREFQEMLAISEKRINQKAYAMTEGVWQSFPSPDTDSLQERERKLDLILSKNPWMSHAFIFDLEKGIVFRSQPQLMISDRYFRDEHDRMAEMFLGWFRLDGKMMVAGLHKRSPAISCYTDQVKRASGYGYQTSALFPLQQLPKDRIVLGGVSFDAMFLKNTFFPKLLEELIAHKLTEQGGNRLAMMVFPAESEGGQEDKLIAASSGWTEGKPEVSRKLSDVFGGLALGIKFQGTTVDALAGRWVEGSFLILGVLSAFMIGGLVLAYRSVSKEVALARLKSDFVSNVSHELRTPLSLIRLYAETLELGRIKTRQKTEEYYRIIREESERLSALINNILDFSRIEAGRKEYQFRETDIAELVRSTLDSYRFQIEQQGFAFEQNIDTNIPAVQVDREAIARALVNLVNNALKYSADEKFLGVKLFQAEDVLKLEVVDRGIGIARRDQTKIFEKFYRTGDPLVHDTKGSGLGLSLVRHITHAHGGKVEVESTPGKGSKFTLCLPLTTAAQPGNGRTEARAS